MHEALERRGGSVLAISTDPVGDLRRLADDLGLRFPLLSDVGGGVVAEYGLLHPGGGPNGSDIAIPAQFLVLPDGAVVWSFVARRIPERADPAEVLETIARHLPEEVR